MDETKVGAILEKIVEGQISEVSDSDLNDILHLLSLDSSSGNQTMVSSIQIEIQKRQKQTENKIAEKGIFWQKWGVILSFIVSVLALAIAILAYLKP